MEQLVEKYGQEIIDFTIKVDLLTSDEVMDIEYLEDRIMTHLEMRG
jgi:hypothetical protein